MSKDDQAGNKAEELRGRAKEGLGKATDNEQWQAEGAAKKKTSQLKQAGEKAKEALTRNDKPGK
ncbi:CsbD family protein [Nocardiopsis halotolerans]|uniref:CsbD family protein n=1 Tax=Nocardiopsis halotolerans TaxID=124252 RepID=UPI00034DD90E|nr:CsbD family protein [Nocardiopsis halotolerans]